MTSRRSCAIVKSRWYLPALTVALGLPLAAALWIGGHPGVGVTAIVIMAVFAIVLLIAGPRSETIRGLGGSDRDERFAMIDLRATAFSGVAVTVALVIAWMVSVATGHSGSPYDWLCVVVGLAYLAGVVYLRWRG
jgi:hypothetical protein